MTARPFRRHLTFTRAAALALSLACSALAVIHLAAQAPASALDVLARDGRRSMAITTVAGQEMVALDELASRFQLNVRDDGGAITVAYRGRSVVLTPDQTIASVAGRLISLPAAPVRTGNRWLVPLDFIARALAPIYDARLDLRRTSHLLVVGDLRVPRVAVRTEAAPGTARVIVDLTPAATAAVSQQGQRLLLRIDADALDLAITPAAATPLVQGVRLADPVNLAIDLGPRFATFKASTQPTDGSARVVVELTATPDATAPPAAPSAPASPGTTAPAASPSATTSAGTSADPLAPAAAGIRTVAIDAGHGGEDVGAKGAGGLLEKDLSLALARRLKSLLESRLGVRVVMTRDDDRLVPPENRSALANNNKADLFISLHANSAFRPTTAGAVAYVASFTDAELATEARAPERLPVFGGGLRAIEIVPWRLAQIPHRDASSRFAQTIVESLGSVGARVPVAARPVEHAPLRVLEAANMPAVLLEVGYLSNVAQEQSLATPESQNALASALLDAIVRFRNQAADSTGGAR